MQKPMEMVVFLPYVPETPPRPIAEALIASLRTGRATIGEDALTGGIEIRLFYDPMILAEIRAWLAERNTVHEISFL